MKRSLWIYMLVLGLLAFLYTYVTVNRPSKISWEQTFAVKDKIPFGTYVASHSLPYLFPQSEITFSRRPVLEMIKKAEQMSPAAYLFVDNYVSLDETEVKHLLDFVEKGNYLFIASRSLPDTLLSFLDLEVKAGFGKMSHTLTGPAVIEKKYVFQKDRFAHFIVNEGFRGDTLGWVEKDSVWGPDFLGVEYGAGGLLLNLNPFAFTNLYVLDSLTSDYYCRVLSYLPVDVNVVWDEYKVLGPVATGSPLRVVLRYPALKYAWFLLLLCGLCYLLFCSKREQRVIPVITPPKNRMLGFIGAVSSLYYKQRDHYQIALKQIDFFLSEVHKRYKFSLKPEEKGFDVVLAERSGVDKRQIEEMTQLIRLIRTDKQVDEIRLRKLMKMLKIFKNNV